MVRVGRRTGAWTRLSQLLAGAAIISACQTTLGANAEAAPPTRAQCVLDQSEVVRRVGDIEASTNNSNTLRDFAASCVAQGDQRPGRQRRNAYFNAGWAYRILGDREIFPAGSPISLDYLLQPHPAPNSSDLENAARYLEIAANMDRDFAPAVLELARVYRLQGRYDRAWEKLVDLERNPDVSRLAVRYERAMFYLWRDGAAGYREALVDLDDFAGVHREEGLLVGRGRRQLIAIAKLLGAEAMAVTPPSSESVTRAIDVLQLAKDAVEADPSILGVVETSQVIVSFATAQLLRAGLSGDGHAAEFGCAEDMAQVSMLSQAQGNFEAARRLLQRQQPPLDSADANWGAGCATRAINERSVGRISALDQAIEYFNRAVDLPASLSNRVRNRLDQARALGAAQRWGEALAAFNIALQLESQTNREGRAARRAAIHVEIARLQLRNANIEDATTNRTPGAAVNAGLPSDADTNAALTSLSAALTEDADHANANLLRGQIRLFRREFGSSLATAVSGAYADLTRVLTLSTAPSERRRQTEANYYLSLRESWIQQDYLAALVDRPNSPPQGPRGNGERAVLHADNASDANPQNAAYRKQACLVRILFGNISDGRVYCTPDAANGANPEALLYEGMYFLRAAYSRRGASQQSDWGRALARFQTGLDTLANSGPEAELMRARLAYGRRTAQFCLGAQSADPAALNDEAAAPHRRFFRISGISGCR